MSRQLPAEGDYTAKCTGQLKVIEAETGTVGIAIPYRLTDSEIPFSDTHTVYIAKSDGTLLSVGIDSLKKVFGWDGQDPWELCWEDPSAETGPKSYPDLEFRLADCKHEQGKKASQDGSFPTYFKPSWLNAMDGGRSFKMADRSAFMKSFGSKLRATSGVAKSTPPKPARKVPPKPAKKAAEPCSAEDAYQAVIDYGKAQNPKVSGDDRLSGLFYEKIAELFPDADQDKLTKQQYGEIKAAFTV